ncbi:glycerophosphodiester phosphodiesterase GDPDL3-like isoform X2 [Apium graveolens]|uniref:glycerophosphodiester phosphodiesterase GDPDL3-like isoform X2 n=1 Tax=Apium graveolens TaxID=4045 RepID=UPI003D7A242C
MLITHAANTSTVWKTFSDAPVAIARGGFSGIFPDSSMIAYKWALLKGLPNMILWCDVQLTSDGVGICFRELTLDSDSDISNVFNNSKKSYIVNGVSTTGWFSVDFTLSALSNISLSQGVPFRPHEFDSSSFQVVTVGDLAGQLNLAGQLKPPGLWLNIQDDGGKKIELKPGFYMEHDENVGAVVVGFDRYFNYYKVHTNTAFALPGSYDKGDAHLLKFRKPSCIYDTWNKNLVGKNKN